MDDFQPDNQDDFQADDFQPDEQQVSNLGQGQSQQPRERTSILKKGWKALALPEQMSRSGLSQLASMVPNPEPTGNLPLDVLRGTPRIASETMAEVAPGFISRGSILTAGALKGAQMAAPLFKSVVGGLGRQLESASGSMPGSLKAAYEDPSLIFSRGKEAAKPLYQAAQEGVPYEQTIFSGLGKNGDIVDKAIETVNQGGKLEPQEALIARKSLDKVRKSFSGDAFNYYRNIFDNLAKANENIAQADPLFKRGLMAQSLRNILPQNKLGGASPFKMGIAPALTGIGGFMGGPAGAAVGAGTAAATLSPIVQGAAATGAGLASKVISPIVNNPALVVTEEIARKYWQQAKSEGLKKASEIRKRTEELLREAGYK